MLLLLGFYRPQGFHKTCRSKQKWLKPFWGDANRQQLFHLQKSILHGLPYSLATSGDGTSRNADTSETTISDFPLQLRGTEPFLGFHSCWEICISQHTANRKADAEHLAETVPLWAWLKILLPLKLLLLWFHSMSFYRSQQAEIFQAKSIKLSFLLSWNKGGLSIQLIWHSARENSFIFLIAFEKRRH